MKTAISLPDELFDRVTRRAAELGMSRSELFARAANKYLDQLDTVTVTTQIDETLAAIGASDPSTTFAVDAGRKTLRGETDKW